MKYGSLILEKKDYVKLKRILNFHRYYEDYAHKDALERLQERIDQALVHDDTDVPDDIVRLNSKVTVVSKGGESQIFHLVSPSEENINEGSISVISTFGANLVGLAVDDTIEIRATSDLATLKIAKVEQLHQLSSGLYSEMDF